MGSNLKIYEMLTQIKNSQTARKSFAVCSKTKLGLKILKILFEENFILQPFIKNNKVIVPLLYRKNKPSIKQIQFFSKPQKFISLTKFELWKFDKASNLLILSTKKGFMSSRQAKKIHQGGVIFCSIN